MRLIACHEDFSVCQVDSFHNLTDQLDFFFIAQTKEERSLVCQTKDVPAHTKVRDDGWKAFYIDGVLDFSLIGILSQISTILANHKIGLFAVSTYNTDYILVKKENFSRALAILKAGGYEISK